MKLLWVSFAVGVLILFTSCDEVENLLNETENGKITATS